MRPTANNHSEISTRRSFYTLLLGFLSLIFCVCSEGHAAAPRKFERSKSSITFRLDSALFDATGRISDFSATLTPGPKGIAGGRLTARINLNSIVFDPMPPEKMFLLQGLLAMIRDPYVEFESSEFKTLDKNKIQVVGHGIYERRKHPVSFVAQMQEASVTSTRLNGSVSSENLSVPAVRSIEQFCGTFTGKATFDLLFSR